jgi:hypothetical protein
MRWSQIADLMQKQQVKHVLDFTFLKQKQRLEKRRTAMWGCFGVKAFSLGRAPIVEKRSTIKNGAA